jgi:hypothetical protein
MLAMPPNRSSPKPSKEGSGRPSRRTTVTSPLARPLVSAAPGDDHAGVVVAGGRTVGTGS